VLPDAEDEGVVESDVGALGLSNVEIVALGVRGGVQGEEGVGRVAARVGQGQTEGEGVGVLLIGMLGLLA
jgi:hypothetical protein